MTFIFYFSIFLFMLLCAVLCFVILIQESKSTGLGASFGGDASESVFGTATADVLKKYWKLRRKDFMSERTFLRTFINPTEGIALIPGVRIKHVAFKEKLGHLRWTLDYPADYTFVRKVYEALYPKHPHFDWKSVLRLVRSHPALSRINVRHIEKART